MKNASEGINELKNILGDVLDSELEQFAEEWEYEARQQRTWDDDTGSAAAAITGYLVGKGDYDKNFGDPQWQQARRAGGRRWPNPPENYEPRVESVEVNESPRKKVVILTNFVPYADDLELGRLGGELFTMMTEMFREPFATTIAISAAEAIRRVSE